MHQTTSPRYYRLLLTTLLWLPAIVMAAPGTLSTTPLYLSTAVEPNIVLLTDDSVSMDWTILTDEGDGVYSISNPEYSWDYYYVHPTKDNIDDQEWLAINSKFNLRTAPPQEWLKDLKADMDAIGNTNWQGVWRLRNHDYNKMYYNPNVTYYPWQGVDNAGNAFANSDPKDARLDPYISAATDRVNLTTDMIFSAAYPGLWVPAAADYELHISNPTGAGPIPLAVLYPARYYKWTDTDADGIVDATDSHELVEIQDGATYDGSASRFDCASAPLCTYAEEIQNFANWFTYHRRRELTAKNALSRVVANITGARVGLATTNNAHADNTKVQSLNPEVTSGNKKALLDKLFSIESSGTNSPLRASLRDVGRYFECVAGNLFNANNSTCPILSSANGGTCQQNFTIVLTDGYYDGDSPGPANLDSIGDTDSDGNTDYDGGNYADRALDGAGDPVTVSDSLADVAMHYYERDLDVGLADDVPTMLGVDEAPHQHMVTYTAAFGVDGTLDPHDTLTPGDMSDTDPSDTNFHWSDPLPNDPTANHAEKIDDLWHAAYNGRGQYLNAHDPDSLNNAISTVLSDIIGRTSSAAAVAFNSTSLGTGSVVYLARFNSVTWEGELLAYPLNPFTGAVDSNPLWNAGTKLDQDTDGMSWQSRLIMTYNDDTNVGTTLDPSTYPTGSNLSAAAQADLNMGPLGFADSLIKQRMEYLMGDDTHEGTGHGFRIRSSVLGDIVHSNPVYVGQPLMNYPNEAPFGGFAVPPDPYSEFKVAQSDPSTGRDGVIYVGSNDGMLHGFDETTGEEVMAYIPSFVHSADTTQGLHYLTNPAYTHRYYVDLGPSVSDVWIQTTPTATQRWRTVLVNGMRGGGHGLFALDITDPSQYSKTNADDIVMWEFTNADDPDLGYTFSKPTITILENGKWAAIVGNGYNSPEGHPDADGQAKLFILYLEGGIDGDWTDAGDYVEISTNVGTRLAPNGLGTPAVIDTDGNGLADRVYAGDLEGNLWAFDLWSGGIAPAFGSKATPEPLFVALDALGNRQPITTKPVAVKHPTEVDGGDPNLLVYFGTGQYLVDGDKTTTGQQTMYGIWDDGTNGYTRADLLEQTLESSSTATSRVVTNNVIDYAGSTHYGWYFDLPDSGERIAVNPKVRGKYVFFNTLVPETVACSFGGYGWLMAVEQIDGSRPDTSIFDVNNDGRINSNDMVAGDAVSGKNFAEGLPAESNFLSDNQYTPGSTGALEQGAIDAGTAIDQGRMSWREIFRTQ